MEELSRHAEMLAQGLQDKGRPAFPALQQNSKTSVWLVSSEHVANFWSIVCHLHQGILEGNHDVVKLIGRIESNYLPFPIQPLCSSIFDTPRVHLHGRYHIRLAQSTSQTWGSLQH